MNALKTTLFSVMVAAMVPFAVAQDSGKEGSWKQDHAQNPDRAKEEPLEYGDWMLDGMLDDSLRMRVRPLEPGVVKLEVQPLEEELGDIVIVICGLDENWVEPLAILNAADAKATTFAIRLEELAKLELAFFAVKAVKVQEEIELRFSKIERARTLVEKARAQEPID